MKKIFGTDRCASILWKGTMALLSLILFTNCESIYDQEGDCSVRYYVEIQFTNNLMEVDAFSSKVPSVMLLVYDKDGQLVTTKTESGSALKREHYTMELDVEPGTYDLVAWCGLEANDHFLLNEGSSPTLLSDAKVRLMRERDESGALSRHQLNPLFHAIARDVTVPQAEGQGDVKVATMDLIKDTNTIRIILTHYNGEEIDPDDFSFAITDNNGSMDFDNTLLDDETITYREWTKRDLPTVGDYLSRADAPITSVNTMIAEIDVARLLTSQNPRLTIRAKDREDDVLSLPITQLLLHAKGEAKRNMPDQEYLDRQDEYNIVFFLSGDESWYTGLGIYINGWHMRIQESEL